ncbi:MAG: histidine phosphatase family protein [Steroidobacteraceae bacterium]
MRELILLRHAHAEAAPLEGNDADRPLSARGRAEASHAAARLLALGLVPDLVLFSPAVRTRETAEILRTALGLPLQAFREVGALYLAAPPILRLQIAAVEPNIHRLMIIGHNPGLSELADALDPQQRSTVLVNAGYVHVSIGGAGWRGVAPA